MLVCLYLSEMVRFWSISEHLLSFVSQGSRRVLSKQELLKKMDLIALSLTNSCAYLIFP